MSEMVEERLFNLLPPIMPIEAKFQLTESFWKHIGFTSTKNYYIGLDVDLEAVSQLVKKHFEKVVIRSAIPNSMDVRLNWLSQSDVGVKQQLINHFRQQEKLLLHEALQIQLPIIINHFKSEKGSLTTHDTQILKVDKHEVRIIFDERVNGVSETAPTRSETAPARSETAPARPVDKAYNWIWWVIGIIIVLWLLSK